MIGLRVSHKMPVKTSVFKMGDEAADAEGPHPDDPHTAAFPQSGQSKAEAEAVVVFDYPGVEAECHQVEENSLPTILEETAGMKGESCLGVSHLRAVDTGR